jgi:protein-S-isoprenylcysteine O-methyltransferase Ste14
MTTKLLLQSFATLVGGTVVLWLVLFLLAGTFDYWQAWVLVPVFTVATIVYGIYFSIMDPALIERRKQAGPAAEQSRLQKIVATVAFSSTVAYFVVSALDRRLSWSQMPPLVSLIGDALVVLAYAIYYVVSRENTFIGASIRVEEGQKVISTGPYAFVRHPKYVGDIVLVVGIALGLGSWWALAILPITFPVLVVRILDEERTLAKDLPGYAEYEGKVRYRLVPPLW